MSDTNEDRLVRIESHVAELEQLVEELNGVIVEQQKQISKLQLQASNFSQLIQWQELERIKETKTKPPHYQ
ncbi:MAG: SlyX family protein [Pedosphaera sp.]|nr:SlyX family protein [Pedosphaera sp.]